MKPIIGLEIHVPLPTKTKLFCGCKTIQRDTKPNRNVCPICLGFPGARPMLNEEAIIQALRIAKALNCEIAEKTMFSRKTYFYPDLPKNFQITQYEPPIGRNGYLSLSNGKKIRIKRIHIEEDPGRITYTSDGRTLIDYNRSGIPLVEIVTEPDMETEREVVEFLELLSAYLLYLGVSNPQSRMRSDLNISLPGSERVEIKNVQGLRNIREAIRYEIERHRKLVSLGMKIKRETLMYDAERGITIPTRTKEYEEDYGYIFEPDLPIINTKKYRSLVTTPEMPDKKLSRIIETQKITSEQEIDKLKSIIYTSTSYTKLIEKLIDGCGYSSKLLNRVHNLYKNLGEALTISMIEKHWEQLRKLFSIALEYGLNDKEIHEKVLEIINTGRFELEEEQKVDIDKVIDEFLDKHPEVIEAIKKDPKSINYFVGQIIKTTGLKRYAKQIIEKLREKTRRE